MNLVAVTLDVTHTLVACPRLGEIYAEVLARHGVAASPDAVRAKIPVVWQELACAASPAADRFASHSEGARGFWRRFVERVCEHLGSPVPSRFAAAELYDRFARADAWEVFPDVRPALAELRRRGLRLGVVSNWDERLPLLLERLELAPFFDAFAVSALVGVEKPHPRMFAAALAELGVGKAEWALHVGDSRREDVEGAESVGMRALHLVRGSAEGDLASLAELPAALDRIE
ncbi:MAG: HAD-IA family hydrolase [Thermoanaerobaculia bacterium]